ncbi:hypothetical protein [Singulisphaera acidiphila]|uniref:Uncharacterized protein n=1 Tax=Singulisphaera acidiphila (strain ATCC BAA-1392 / DSM 18658 / VKM B-2454 / MOB10) TaxID=886293 RepID=L0DPM2_SINAD|nr:hypothetical protein [Singulisphaera acidiphila]AGA30631.1 hypothetical protein Sinac_6556 [Singulisphaera acidiphila DSM 18658]
MSTIVTVTLALAMSSTGGFFSGGGRILPPQPGNGAGFPNGNPDGYGYIDYGTYLPLGADRTADWYFQRQFAVPPNQMFMPTYYNAYVTRGQRYIPYSGCGGCHPMGAPPIATAHTPVHPYQDTIGAGPRVPVPAFTGRVEAPPVNSGGTGLTP